MKTRSLEYPGEHKNFLFDPKEDPRGVALRSQMKKQPMHGSAARLNLVKEGVQLLVLPSIRASDFPVIKGQINREK